MSEETRAPKQQTDVDTEKAAILSRLKSELRSLASARAGGIAAVCYLDPSQRLKGLLRSIEHAARFLDLRLANRVHKLVLRIVTKPAIKKGVVLKLDPKGVEWSSRLLTETTRLLASSLTSHKRTTPTQIGAFAKGCTSTLCQFCEICESQAAWKYVLEYVRDATSLADLRLDEFLSEENLGHRYRLIEGGFIAALNWFLKIGDTVALSELAGLARRHEALADQATSHLTQLFSEQAAALPNTSQKWMMDQLGLTRPGRDFDYADPAHTPEIREAAALLLYLFDRQVSSVELKEAFERYRGLCEAHFHLFLRGEVGKLVQFNSRLHENPDSSVGDLRLIRPWVEWFLPPDTRVVIRGIVESSRSERKVD